MISKILATFVKIKLSLKKYLYYKKINMEFVDKILPGNYWLSKSMEFVKIKSSGTLWYLKKWIVYYYYIFLKGFTHVYSK